MRAVIDTNVIAGAMLTARMDPPTRPRLPARSQMSGHDRFELLAAFASVSERVAASFACGPNLQDEGDNHLIELAAAGSASAIITNNVKDLRSGEILFLSIRVLTPSDLVKELHWVHKR